MSIRFLFPFLALAGLSACSSVPQGAFRPDLAPAAPDYSQDEHWAALPWTEDPADLTPDGLKDKQAEAQADVFFLHPTTYTGQRGDENWNGSIVEPDLRERTLETPIQFQASLFNGAGRVFAPFYRQAHLNAYRNADTLSAHKAFELAYQDVKQAFAYYLEHYNEGRPIIIATHSQGTTHGKRLVKEYFDGQPLHDQLVVAYLIGIPVRKTDFEQLKPCEGELDTGCYTAWRTYRRGHTPQSEDPEVVVVNPLNWTSSDTYAPKSLNKGAVLRPFKKVRPGNVDAQVNGPILWSSKPRFFGSILLRSSNYHAGDFNLFYVDVRENAQARVQAFLDRQE